MDNLGGVSTPPVRVLFVQHEDECPPEWFGEWLAAAGLSVDVVNGHRGEPIATSIPEYHALVVLGGAMGANDDDTSPWLGPTKELIADTVRARRPFLGICLGHQLATVALGGEVVVNPSGQAVGLTPVTRNEEGLADPLLSAIEDEARAVQWNGDIASRLPGDAVALASAPDGTVQAARFGPRAWGVQFHPEASPEVFRSWVDDAGDRPQHIDFKAVADEIDAARDELRRAWEPLARRFAQLVLAEPQPR